MCRMKKSLVINANCNIVARMVKGAKNLQKQLELVANDN